MSTPEETAPLLPQPSEDDPPATPPDSPVQSWTRAQKITVALVACYAIFGEMADILRFAPSIRLFELGYCRHYYLRNAPNMVGSDGNVLESYCKLSTIQENLSWLKAWLNTLEGLVGMILVLPYGALAEATGGRFIMLLNTAGHTLSTVWIVVICFFWKTFPVDVAVASPLFRAIGGGAPVVSAVSLAIVANAVPASMRATVFFFTGAVILVTELIAPLISSAFLARGYIYSPILLGFVFEVLAMLSACSIPMDAPRDRPEESREIQPENLSRDQYEEPSPPSPSTSHPRKTTLWNRLSYFPRELFHKNILVLLFAFATAKMGRQILEMLVQYTSKRFGWSFAQGNVLFSIRAAIALVVLLVVLPLIKSFFQNRLRFPTERIDFGIGVASTALFACGSLLMGISNEVPPFLIGLVIFTFGRGGQEALQSFLTSLVEREQLTRLYTYIALFDGFGAALGALLINGALKEGIHRGGVWLGLPFFVATGAYLISLVGVLLIR